MDHLLRDLRYSWRSFRKNPAFTVTAVLTLALGIGANSALFSVIDGVLFKPLPYPAPERLFRAFDSNETFPRFALSPANFLDFREALEGTAELTTYVRDDVELTAGERSERLLGMRVSAGFFRVLGLEPVLGRGFSRELETPGNELVAVVSDRFWRRHFEGDAAAIGRGLVLDGVTHTVIGVLPPGVQHVGGSFRSLPHGTVVDVWRPRAFESEELRGAHFLNGLGRLAPGATLAEAQARLDGESARLAGLFPRSNGGWKVALVGLRDEIVGEARAMLAVCFGAVFLVLLVACVNVASLLLARASARRSEIAVRRALGAGRGRLVRQWLAESLLLATAGGLGGLLLGVAGIGVLRELGPEQLPRLHMVGLDLRVSAFTAATALCAVLFFGVAPLVQLLGDRSYPNAAGRFNGGRRESGLRRLLVATELAMAIVLLSGAGLLVASLIHMRQTDPGFDPRGVLTARVSLPAARYPDGIAQSTFFARLTARLAALPGVVAAGAGNSLPWSGYDENLSFAPEGRPSPDVEDPRVRARFHQATPGYFAALSIPLLEGRFFTHADDAEAPHRVIVNRQLARWAWPEEDAVGRRLTFSRKPGEEDWWTVVGVVGDLRDTPDGEGVLPAIYFPYPQAPWWRELVVAVRADVEPSALISAVRREVKALDPDLPLGSLGTLETLCDRALNTPRFLSWLVGTFATVAVALAAVGLTGLLAYSVSRRRREIAVRLAVGARSSQITRQLMGEGLRLAAIGVTLGIAAALGLSRLMTDLLYGVRPGDPTTLVLSSAALMAVAALATCLPARRASRIEPAAVLRGE